MQFVSWHVVNEIKNFISNYSSRFMLTYKESNIQITTDHDSFIKYSYRYIFRSRGVIIRLALRTY